MTCAHVVKKTTRAICPKPPYKDYPVKIVVTDAHKDLAILEVVGAHHDVELLPAGPDSVRQSASVRVLGFPNYVPGHDCAVRSGGVTAITVISGNKRILIDANIISGNSGGPVLDLNNCVIGVAAKGAVSQTAATATDKHEVIPIEDLLKMKP